MGVHFDSFCKAFILSLKGAMTHNLELGLDAVGNITRIGNRLDAMSERLTETKEDMANVQRQLENAKEEVVKPFPKEAELNEKQARLNELNALLNMDEKGSEVIEDEAGVPANDEADTPIEEVSEAVQEYRAERKPVRLSERISCMKEKAEAENEGRGVIAGKIKREEIG